MMRRSARSALAALAAAVCFASVCGHAQSSSRGGRKGGRNSCAAKPDYGSDVDVGCAAEQLQAAVTDKFVKFSVAVNCVAEAYDERGNGNVDLEQAAKCAKCFEDIDENDFVDDALDCAYEYVPLSSGTCSSALDELENGADVKEAGLEVLKCWNSASRGRGLDWCVRQMSMDRMRRTSFDEMKYMATCEKTTLKDVMEKLGELKQASAAEKAESGGRRIRGRGRQGQRRRGGGRRGREGGGNERGGGGGGGKKNRGLKKMLKRELVALMVMSICDAEIPRHDEQRREQCLQCFRLVGPRGGLKTSRGREQVATCTTTYLANANYNACLLLNGTEAGGGGERRPRDRQNTSPPMMNNGRALKECFAEKLMLGVLEDCVKEGEAFGQNVKERYLNSMKCVKRKAWDYVMDNGGDLAKIFYATLASFDPDMDDMEEDEDDDYLLAI